MPAYMKYGDIKGNAKAPHYEWIVIQSFSLGDARTGRVGEVYVTKRPDISSTSLQRELIRGTASDVTIALTNTEDGEEQDFVIIKLKGVMISSFQLSGELESLTLNFETIEYEFKKASGYDSSDWAY